MDICESQYIQNLHKQRRRFRYETASVVCLVWSIKLCLVVFLDSEFAAIVTAGGAYMVIHNGLAAVAASRELGCLQTVVRSSLSRTGL